MHMHLQRLQRPDGDRILFGVKCALEATPAERDLMEKYHAVDPSHLKVEHVSTIQGLMAGGLVYWNDDVRSAQIIERDWFQAVNALAAYLSDATRFHTEGAEGDDVVVGSFESGSGRFWPGVDVNIEA
jgi:hypothetical protein